jgi:hypothetical protein
MARRGVSSSQQSSSDNKIALGAAAGGMLGGVGGTTITSCPATDQSFYCKFVRMFNIIKMIIAIIVFAVLLYFLYVWFFAKK